MGTGPEEWVGGGMLTTGLNHVGRMGWGGEGIGGNVVSLVPGAWLSISSGLLLSLNLLTKEPTGYKSSDDGVETLTLFNEVSL